MTARASERDTARREKPFHLKVAALMRWLHIYLSLFSLLAVLFFSVTGITLNHPEWFEKSAPREREVSGSVTKDWVATGKSENEVARLEVVEYLRKQHGIHGSLDEFRVDEAECLVSFKGPGYTSDTYIQRADGSYKMTVIEEGFVAVMNDLHKGRNSGVAWRGLIDVSAGLLVFVSLTGLGLLFFLKRLRTAGLLTGLAGAVLLFLIARFFVP